jgi:hypothetical protein
MKIEYTDKQAKLFSEITEGTVFKNDGDFYMKTEALSDTYLGKVANAVHLESGNMCRFDDDETVFIVDCKLVIES